MDARQMRRGEWLRAITVAVAALGALACEGGSCGGADTGCVPPPPPPAYDLQVTPERVLLHRGETQQFQATHDGQPAVVNWSVFPAEGGTITPDGTFTASGASVGTVGVHATVRHDGYTYGAHADVTVPNPLCAHDALYWRTVKYAPMDMPFTCVAPHRWSQPLVVGFDPQQEPGWGDRFRIVAVDGLGAAASETAWGVAPGGGALSPPAAVTCLPDGDPIDVWITSPGVEYPVTFDETTLELTLGTTVSPTGLARRP